MAAQRKGSESFLDRQAFNLRRRSEFYADMARFMDSDIPPKQALDRMEGIARRRRATQRLAKVYRAMLRDLTRGKSFAQSVAAWAPGGEAVMLVGAEQAGPAVFMLAMRELAILLERQQRARSKLRSALLANGLVFLVIIGVIVEVVTMIVPELVKDETKVMVAHMSFAPYFFAFGEWIFHYGVYLVIPVVAIAAVIGWSLPNWTRSRLLSREWFDRSLMPWTLYKRMQATFFLSTTAAMMRSGIPLKKIATDMMPFGSKWMKFHLRRLLRHLELGKSEVEALGAGMLPRDSSDRLQIYAVMKDFTAIMTRLSEDNFQLYEKSIDQVAGTLKFFSILILGVFAVALLFAIFDYSNAVTASVHAMQMQAG